MEEVNPKKLKVIDEQTAIKCAQASIYALKHSGTEITPKSIEEEMKMHFKRYDNKMISLLVKAYIQEEKKK